jgi:hypothetical protein
MVEVGHVVLVYDDVGEIHADCDAPFSLTPDLDDESGSPWVLLGSPMRLYPIDGLLKWYDDARAVFAANVQIVAPYGTRPDGTPKDLGDLE